MSPHEHGRNGDVAMQLAVLLDGPTRAAELEQGGTFDLGEESDVRGPDLGVHRGAPSRLSFSTAALVIEVLRDLLGVTAAEVEAALRWP